MRLEDAIEKLIAQLKEKSDPKQEFELTLELDNDDIPKYIENLQKVRNPEMGIKLSTKAKATA